MPAALDLKEEILALKKARNAVMVRRRETAEVSA